ncbi:MAG: 3-deoxy-manno-octulosonate cytidylyltransferase [Planctomycetales bacterium]|nr:3-deoxy-manno-octulosonate cytidylyltransferase [Planctomycetales bacterium]
MASSDQTLKSMQIAQPRRVLVIPARRRSTRLPDKLMLRVGGRTVLEHTYDVARRVERAELCLIATDDEEIAAEARSFGAAAVMTSVDCPSGADRVAEAVRRIPSAEIIVNLQGDEPDASPADVDRVFQLLEDDPQAGMATLCTPIRTRAMLEDPACVKVVCDEGGRALYFSRSPIPHPREWDESLLVSEPPAFLQHLGIYAYRRALLEKMTSLPPSRLEQIERLEQLRVLECGETIRIAQVAAASRGIDTPADFEAFAARRRAG